MAVRRCRVCTTVINPEAPEAARQEVVPVMPSGPVVPDHFDAGVIDRQIQPARGRFEASSGLSSRLAAAQTGEPGVPQAIAESDDAATAWVAPPPRHAPSPPPPASSGEQERFDPDALFRDLDS
jgi:hypothetical protein